MINQAVTPPVAFLSSASLSPQIGDPWGPQKEESVDFPIKNCDL